MRSWSSSGLVRTLAVCFVVAIVGVGAIAQQQPPPRFGGAYAGLDARRQTLVNGWVSRFHQATGQSLEPERLYDELLSVSTKTTFDAVTHALMTIQLTDASGAKLGDTLALVERVESVRGEVDGSPGDRQFRIYARLTPDAVTTLARSQQFKRGADNVVFHKGYPTNYRGQGGIPSVQISIARDGRRADIDVDYRSAMFPVSLFNGHLASSNSDVRAGSNYDKHLNRWTGFQNWWRGFFGAKQDELPEAAAPASPLALPKTPRVGRANIDVAVNDFLSAWLIEGNIIAAMGYVSERSYACLAQDSDNPADFDRGLAPFQLMMNLKSTHDALGERRSLNDVVVGTRLTMPGLKVVTQPHHAQFVIYSVPDDAAMTFDCEGRLTPGDAGKTPRAYGTYFGATFYIDGRHDFPVALLWAQEDRYWKIVSWQVGSNSAVGPDAEPIASPKLTRVKADATLVQAAQGFLDSWLIRKDYDAAFKYIAPAAYACYDVERGPGAPPSTSPEDAGRKLRDSLEAAAKTVAGAKTLESVLTAVEPYHPATRILDHQYPRVFSLTSPPNALVDATECTAQAASSNIPDPLPLEYGKGYGMTVRFKTRSGNAPVLRLLWRQEQGTWRITAYGIELP